MIYTPHDYQIDAAEFLYQNRYAFIFGAMGVGKCYIILLFLQRITTGVLIIAPLRVTSLTWPIEISKFAPHLSYTILYGKDKEARIKEKHDIYLVSYSSIKWLYEFLRDNRTVCKSFKVLILDESSFLKSHSTKRYKYIKAILPLFTRRIALTGTPAPNSYINLFSQFYCVDAGATLGKFITKYKARFFDQSWNGYTWTIKPGAQQQIDKLISPIVFRIESDNKFDVTYTDVDISLPVDVMKKYSELEKQQFLSIDEDEIVAANAAVLLGKCIQFTSGSVYDEDRNVINIHDAKLHALDKIGGPVLIIYQYRHELSRIKNRYPDAVEFTAGDVKQTLALWDAGKIDKLIAHSASIGHGLNLQSQSKIVWFSLTFSLEQYLQTNARLIRQGQKNPVEVLHLIVPGTVDVLVKTVLESKDNQQQALLNAMAAYRRNVR